MHRKDSFTKQTYINKRKKANKVKVIEEIKLSKPITYKAGATSDKKIS